MPRFLICVCLLGFSNALLSDEAHSDRVAQCFGKIFETYVKAHLNRLENPVMIVDGAKPLDILFDHDLDTSGFSYGEKKELAFMVLIAIPILDAAGADTFRYCLRPDAVRIGADLSKVSDDILKKRFYFDEARIKEYRLLVEILKTQELMTPSVLKRGRHGWHLDGSWLFGGLSGVAANNRDMGDRGQGIWGIGVSVQLLTHFSFLVCFLECAIDKISQSVWRLPLPCLKSGPSQ
jgi:hypothetical protein